MQKLANLGKNYRKNAKHQRAERQKIDDGREQERDKHEQAQIARSGRNGKKQQKNAHAQSKQCVEANRQSRKAAAQRAQQVVQKTQQQPKRRALREQKRLRRDGQLHQPKRREKKPPRDGSSS